MTAIAISSGASSSVSEVDLSNLEWKDIPWNEVTKTVRRLQMRIAKAYREGKHGKVKSLQWILTHSFYAKLLAVKRVTGNHGAKTPGVDNIIWRTQKQKMEATLSLKRRGYKTQPLKRIYIPKKEKGKLRPLSIPVMKCRGQQALYLLALEPITETIADKNSYGFRPFRSTADAHEQCHTILSRGNSAQFILEGDIKTCFDKISHQWLINHTPIDKEMLKKWLSAGYLEKGELFQTNFGTPQGGVISPALLIVTLSGLEQRVKSAVLKRGDKVNVCIYADDFIITGATREVLENKVMPTVETFLKERGLELSKEKTKITHINEGFDFLGANIRKYNGRIISKPSKSSVKKFLDNIRETVKSNKAAKTENIIRQLNPKIIGWSNYYRHVCAKRTFTNVSHHIFQILWRWATRRHPNKGLKWIQYKYFRSKAKQRWVFSSKIKDNGSYKYLDLVEMNKTPIRRHVKIKGEATPYDPAYLKYFSERQKRRENKKLFRPCKSSWSPWWELKS